MSAYIKFEPDKPMLFQTDHFNPGWHHAPLSVGAQRYRPMLLDEPSYREVNQPADRQQRQQGKQQPGTELGLPQQWMALMREADGMNGQQQAERKMPGRMPEPSNG